MSQTLRIDFIVEDSAQERFLQEVVKRYFSNKGCDVDMITISNHGGRGEVYRTLKQYEKQWCSNEVSFPHKLVIGSDGNCQGYVYRRNEILSQISDLTLRSVIACACPDPHIEKWYMLDEEAFNKVVGVVPNLPANKCEKSLYKNLLKKRVEDSGSFSTLGGVEYAEELVLEADFYRMGKAENAFKLFLSDL